MAWLPPGILFSPDDEVAVGHYLLPRLLHGRPVPTDGHDGLILDDDPLSAPPWELLERNGRKEQAFFFAEGQARCGKGTRQRRTCAGGTGWWEGQKTCAEGHNLPFAGGCACAWRKKAFNFHSGTGDGKRNRSAGWVMHEYAVTSPEEVARSPLRLYHIRLSSYGRKQQSGGAMAVPRELGFPPGFVFAPEDADVVVHYLLPRLLGRPLPMEGLVVDDDPLSAPPWELMERNGRGEDAFFFAMGQARSGKGSRQKRTCNGGGFWNGEKMCVDGEKLLVDDGTGGVEEVAWRKKALSFQEGGVGGEKGSTGWVMHEYAITAPDHLAESQLRLYRIRFSGHGKKRKRVGGGGGAAGDSSCGDDEPGRALAQRRCFQDDALFDVSSLLHSSSSTEPLIDQNQNCIISGADHHADAEPLTLPPGVDTYCDDSMEGFDIDEFLSSIEVEDFPLPSPNACVLPEATHLEADDGTASSSFFCPTTATAPPCSAGDAALMAPMMMYHGCLDPMDSLISFAAPNQFYAAC